MSRNPDTFTDRPFFGYSLFTWTHHTRAAEAQDPDLVQLVVELLHNKNALINCIAAHDEKFCHYDCALDDLDGFVDPLYAATSFGLKAVVEILLTKGANLDGQPGSMRGNPLCLAASRGQNDFVKLLLDAGARVHVRDGDFGNALLADSCRGHASTIQLLLAHDEDVDPESRECDLGDALREAFRFQHFNVVEVLLKNGADVNSSGGSYHTALQAVLSVDHDDRRPVGRESTRLPTSSPTNRKILDRYTTMEQLEVTSANATTEATFSGLREGIGSKSIAELLLDQRASLKAQGGRHLNALNSALVEGNPRHIRLLLNRGARFDRFNSDHALYALCQAASRGDQETVDLLLDIGVKPDQLPCSISTDSLSELGFGGYIDNSVPRLVDKGTDDRPNRYLGRRIYGYPLHRASSNGHANIVQTLLAKGAKIDADVQGFTALHYASANDHRSVVDLLFTSGADINAYARGFGIPLRAAINEGHLGLAEVLLDHGSDINSTSDQAGSFLQIALRKNYMQLAASLIRRGININNISRSLDDVPQYLAALRKMVNWEQIESFSKEEEAISRTLRGAAQKNRGRRSRDLPTRTRRSSETVSKILMPMGIYIPQVVNIQRIWCEQGGSVVARAINHDRGNLHQELREKKVQKESAEVD